MVSWQVRPKEGVGFIREVDGNVLYLDEMAELHLNWNSTVRTGALRSEGNEEYIFARKKVAFGKRA